MDVAPAGDAVAAKPAPPLPPALPAALGEKQRAACQELVFLALKLTLDAKKALTKEQREALCTAVGRVVAAFPERDRTAFPLAVAVWLRDKRELGNRLISTALLAAAACNPATRPYARQAAHLVLRLPTDLQDFLAEFDAVQAAALTLEGCPKSPPEDAAAKRPACIKKIAKDVMEALTPYQASKYDVKSRLHRVRQQLKAAQAQLLEVEEPTEGENVHNHVLHPKSFKKGANSENQRRQLEKRIAELKAKHEKLKAGDLRGLIRYTHISDRPELIMGILGKRYPCTEEDFRESGLPGEFDPKRCHERIRLEAAQTWERELSEKGNAPPTWAALLTAKDDKDRHTLPYMALLRNLRNILLMGFPTAFLRKQVLSRLMQRNQILGSGQTAISLSHTWSVLEKEFTKEKMYEMREQSRAGIRDILAYKALLRKIRGPLLGTSDKQVGIIGEFLGEPVWAPCGLQKVGDCFLTLNQVLVRDGQAAQTISKARQPKGKGKGKGKGKAEGKDAQKTGKWLPVAVHPPTAALMAEFKEAFDQAIQTAAASAVGALELEGPGPVILWMDLSNPPLEVASASTPTARAPEEAVAPGSEADIEEPPQAPNTGNIPPPPLAGLQCEPCTITTQPGQEVELDEITTHRRVNLELRYFCSSYVDYNLQAYDASGNSLWNATYSNAQIKNASDTNCVVHCRDIGSNPDAKTPALRTLHLDLDALNPDVFALMVTSQNYCGQQIRSCSIALRECHNGGAASLLGNHTPHDCKGKVILAQDIGEPLKRGGTTVYACLHRDVNDPDSWSFRNILDLSLDSESRVAAQITQVAGSVFRKLFQDSALASTLDANRLGYVRLCQLYQAALAEPAARGRSKGAEDGAEAAAGGAGAADVHVVLSGVRKRQAEPSVMKVKLTGRYVRDLDAVREAKKQFAGKAVDANTSMSLVMEAAGCGPDSGKAPRAVFRVANNSHLPGEALEAARKRAGQPFLYASIDARGHIFDALSTLPDLERAVFLPGQVESCVAMLRNILSQPAGAVGAAEMIVRYVDSFLPRARDAQAAPAPEPEAA